MEGFVNRFKKQVQQMRENGEFEDGKIEQIPTQENKYQQEYLGTFVQSDPLNVSQLELSEYKKSIEVALHEYKKFYKDLEIETLPDHSKLWPNVYKYPKVNYEEFTMLQSALHEYKKVYKDLKIETLPDHSKLWPNDIKLKSNKIFTSDCPVFTRDPVSTLENDMRIDKFRKPIHSHERSGETEREELIKDSKEKNINSLQSIRDIIELEHGMIEMSFGGYRDDKGIKVFTIEVHKESMIYDKDEGCYVEVFDTQEGVSNILVDFINIVSTGYSVIFKDSQVHIVYDDELRKNQSNYGIDYGTCDNSYSSTILSFEGKKVNVLSHRIIRKNNTKPKNTSDAINPCLDIPIGRVNKNGQYFTGKEVSSNKLEVKFTEYENKKIQDAFKVWGDALKHDADNIKDSGGI